MFYLYFSCYIGKYQSYDNDIGHISEYLAVIYSSCFTISYVKCVSLTNRSVVVVCRVPAVNAARFTAACRLIVQP